MPERKLPVVYVVVDETTGAVEGHSVCRDVVERVANVLHYVDESREFKVVEYIPRAQANEDATRVFSAWLRDRAEQYSNDSCCRCVFDELLTALDQGEPWEALKHGELDDILKRNAKRKARGDG